MEQGWRGVKEHLYRVKAMNDRVAMRYIALILIVIGCVSFVAVMALIIGNYMEDQHRLMNQGEGYVAPYWEAKIHYTDGEIVKMRLKNLGSIQAEGSSYVIYLGKKRQFIPMRLVMRIVVYQAGGGNDESPNVE